MDPCKYALALMDAIFTDVEMSTCCFSAGKRSTKPELPRHKIKLLEGMFLKTIMTLPYSLQSTVELIMHLYLTSTLVFTTIFQSVDCIDQKYGSGTTVKHEQDIKRKCNQKCLDVCSKRKKRAQAPEN